MPFFNRLTDIVTCSLTSILAAAEDPQQALRDIIREMEQGTNCAHRSMKTAHDNESRIRTEVDGQRLQSQHWVNAAREQLVAGNEGQARQYLLRKHEADSLLAGLEVQLKAATATREHLTTTFHALEARLADARRRMASLQAGELEAAICPTPAAGVSPIDSNTGALDVIDVELAALKRELESEGM
ncbi:MAG: PspA/IM30 family protein [Planctomycetaceae bacterium]